MPSSRLLPGRAAIAAATPDRRDRAVDVARIASLVVVMAAHCVLLLATIGSGGVETGNLLGELPALEPVTWLLQIMPLFFVAGGAAAAYGWRDGTAWGPWLLTRAQRLVRPVLWYLAAWAVLLAAVRALAGEASASRMGNESVALLWFVGVYLVVLGFVPALCRIRTAGALAGVLIALIGATAVFDAARIATGAREYGYVNFLLAWLIPTAIGVGYAKRLVAPRVAGVVALGALALNIGIVAAGPYALSLATTGRDELSNVSPPTVVLALHATVFGFGFVAVAGRLDRWARRPRVWHAVAVGNSGAMTLYLWHIPAIAAAIGLLHLADLDAFDVHRPDFGLRMALRVLVFAVVMAVMFVALLPLEHRRLPWWDAPLPVRLGPVRSALVGTLVGVAGVAILLTAKEGLGASAGWQALGIFLTALALARIAGRP